MYPVRILGIAPYLGLERIMQQLAAQRPEIQLITRIGNLRNWQDALNSVPASSYDVIISRGGTARMLARFARTPVIEITTSVYDMLCSLRNAQGYTGKIAVVGHSNITERAQQLAEIMQYDIVVRPIRDNADLHQAILQPAHKKMPVRHKRLIATKIRHIDPFADFLLRAVFLAALFCL